MPQIFQKVTDEAGGETYQEVDINAIELPEDHPANLKVKQVFQERRKQVDSLREQLADALKAQGASGDVVADVTPAQPAKTDATAQVVVDPASIAKTVLELLQAQQKTELEAQSQRTASVDAILKETGLDVTYRPVIEAIADPVAAKASAVLLKKQSARFEEVPGGENGGRDMTTLLKSLDERLGFNE